jgi:hypothetical protein
MSTGHLAESPGDVRVGDSVYIIEWSVFPFVLRCRGKQFLVVGKADIYRMRQQDAWEPSKLDEDPKGHDIVLVWGVVCQAPEGVLGGSYQEVAEYA